VKVVIVVILAIICQTGCDYHIPNILPQEPNVASIDPQNWYLFSSDGVSLHPSTDPVGAWAFEFPIGGVVRYVETPFNATITPHRVSMTFKIEAQVPQYVVVDPTDHLPATIRLIFQQRNDDFNNPNGRWWAAGKFYDLGSQDGDTITLIFPFTPDSWSNVYGVNGTQDPQAFEAALANVGWVGFTCGGQYFAGHGVGLSGGTAKFLLVDYYIN
jgi:hypothetical protein